ncbi:hypothetical protein MYX82_11730 [Acidobacteria bacterium AH-259-D05]|nr:hypothetical protein [Acidobacteria bacterium AH-259-D05]
MAEEHIPFSQRDFDSTEDQSHVENCEMCRKRWSIFRFLGFQVKAAPQMDVPPFFAQRVTQLVRSTRLPFAFFFQRAAQQLIPVFLVLVLATSFLLYTMIRPESTEELYSELFFDQALQEDLSLDYVVDSLRELPEEDSIP